MLRVFAFLLTPLAVALANPLSDWGAAQAQTPRPGTPQSYTPYSTPYGANTQWYCSSAIGSDGSCAVSGLAATLGTMGAINVKNYGATGGGSSDDAAAIGTAIAALPAAGGTLFFPCGTYLIGSTIAVPSNTKVLGEGACSQLKAKSGMSQYAPFNTATGSNAVILLTNNNYPSGNTNIVVEDMGFDQTNIAGSPTTGTFAWLGFKVTNAVINRITSNEGGDGTAFLESTNYTVENSVFTKCWNACVDQWDGDTYFSIVNNKIDPSGSIKSSPTGWGVLVTGVNTALNASTPSDNWIISHNNIKNAINAGIWVQGNNYNSGANCGLVEYGTINNNDIRNTTGFYGIEISEADSINVTGNNVQISNKQALEITNISLATCTETNINITGNSFNSNGTTEAVAIAGKSSGISLENNVITPTGSGAYGLTVASNAVNIDYSNNDIRTGSSGYINNLASATYSFPYNYRSIFPATSMPPCVAGLEGSTARTNSSGAVTYNGAITTGGSNWGFMICRNAAWTYH